MIKKAGAVLLAMLYVVTASGFALNLHYCGNHVASVKINAPAKSCAKPMAKMKMNCCKDAKLDVKVKDSHETQPTSSLAKLVAFVVPNINLGDYFFAAQKMLIEKFADSSPPDKPVISACIFAKNCFIRI